ncbi:hypothetical protein Pfo_019273, partial [Paulownia fortunei]
KPKPPTTPTPSFILFRKIYIKPEILASVPCNTNYISGLWRKTMAQIAKIEAKTQILCPPAKVYDFFKCKGNQFINVLPLIFKSIKLLEGEEGQAGNVKLVEFVLGTTMSVKVKTEAINDAERSITFVALEGDILNLYISFKVKLTVSDGFVLFCFEFEKANDWSPNPDIYAKLAVGITKGLDLYLLFH